MSELGFHMMFRADDDRVLAPRPELRRALAVSIYRVAAPFPLLAFGAADTHLHLEALCERKAATDLAHRVMCSLRWSLGLTVPFRPVRMKRLDDQHHLVATFHYVLKQRNRHGVATDPCLDASSLPELLGMRVISSDTLRRVREHIPRLRRDELLAHLGPAALEPAGDDLLQHLIAMGRGDLLRDAAAGAAGLPDLTGNRPRVVAARAALVRLLSRCCPARAVAEVVGCASPTIRRLRTTPRDERLERALRLQAAMRTWLLQTHPELVEPE